MFDLPNNPSLSLSITYSDNAPSVPSALTLLDSSGSAVSTSNPVEDSISVSWSASTDDFTSASAILYTLEYSSNNGASWNVIMNSTGTTSYSWNVSSLSAGSQYLARVKATDSLSQASAYATSSNFAIRHAQTYSLRQLGSASIGNSIVFYRVSGFSGTSTAPFYHSVSIPSDAVAVINITKPDGSSASSSITSSSVSFTADSDGNWTVFFNMPAPQISEQPIQTISATLSNQQLLQQFTVSNPSSVSYSNLIGSVSCAFPSSFGSCNQSGVSISSLAAGSSTSIFISSSGSAIFHNFSSFSQDSSAETIAGGQAHVKKQISVSNNLPVSITLSGLSFGNETRTGWNCNYPSSISLSASSSHSNSSFISCWKNDAVSISENQWVQNSTTESTIDSAYIVKQLTVSNNDPSVQYSTISLPTFNITGNLSSVSYSSVSSFSLIPNASSAHSVLLSSDFINNSLSISRTNSSEQYIFQAGNTTSLSNVRGWIDINDSFVNSNLSLLLSVSSFWQDITPSATCPSYSSFAINNATWKTCKKDTDSDGLTDRFEFVIPHFSSIILNATGTSYQAPAPTPTPSPSPTPNATATPSPTSNASSTSTPTASANSQPSSGSGNSGGSWQTPGGSGSTSPSATQNPAISSPSLPSSQNESGAKKTIISNVEIRSEESLKTGYGTIVIFSSGKPATGQVEITDPTGKLYLKDLDANGSLSFFFDKKGTWKIAYGGQEKTISVGQGTGQNSSQTVKSAADDKPSGLIGAFSAGNSTYVGIIFLIVLVTFSAFYKVSYATVKLKKSFSMDEVSIDALNNKADMKDVTLIELVPEEAEASNFSEEPSEKEETVLGKMFKWHKAELKKGDSWKISYSLLLKRTNNEKKLKGCELKGLAGSKKIVIHSNEVKAWN